MKIIKDLWWFFRQEKRRYLIGIISLSLVAVLNLIPPKVMGTVIDRVTAGDLTHSELLLNLLWLVLSAVAMYFFALHLAHVHFWNVLSFGANYAF